MTCGGPRSDSGSAGGGVGAARRSKRLTRTPMGARAIVSGRARTTTSSTEILCGGTSPLWLNVIAGCELARRESAARDSAGTQLSVMMRRRGSASAPGLHGARRTTTGGRVNTRIDSIAPLRCDQWRAAGAGFVHCRNPRPRYVRGSRAARPVRSRRGASDRSTRDRCRRGTCRGTAHPRRYPLRRSSSLRAPAARTSRRRR